MRRIYIHDLKGWPRLQWDRERLAEPLAAVRLRQAAVVMAQCPAVVVAEEAVAEAVVVAAVAARPHR